MKGNNTMCKHAVMRQDNGTLLCWKCDKEVISHYGVFLALDEITTGVYNGNQINWDCMDYDFICLDCESAIQEFKDMNPDYTDSELDQEYDSLYCDGHTHLYGSWVLDDKDNYMPDESGDYSIIYNSNYNTLQVIWSETIITGGLCSPCYPGQVDVGSQGDFKAYGLPDWLIYNPNTD